MKDFSDDFELLYHNPYLIARLTGLSLGSLDVLLRRFEINIDEQSNIGEMINREISKFQFYQDI